MKTKYPLPCLYFLLVLVLFPFPGHAQSVTIKEEILQLDTYGFSNPDPVPILTDNPKIFPYFKFYGYEQESKNRPWKVVTLENDYIKVFVLPEIGGKIWGAIEKSTGMEFLYKNEVMKFRNIAMRGPWTSGGIEFNFGLIGHSPDTATPVDYVTRENEDGSVSCIVGSMDLTSRTHWGVEIRLEANKAYVETNTFWYNGTPLNQSYYNWMTAAAEVADDLEFIYPGNQYLEHSGDAQPWPVDDEGRNTAFYKNNQYGGAKSKHVVGEYRDFFGGYYHDRRFGFGHWAPYEEMPGQKLWLWALSRSGGIWEDLLTDTDGQYMEFQAGRLFNQYFPGAENPISQANFDPYVMDRWREIWYPYKEIGGIVDASEHGVLNVKEENETLYIGLNALQDLDKKIQVKVDGMGVFSKTLDLKPMEVFSETMDVPPSTKIEVEVEDSELFYSNSPELYRIKRPFTGGDIQLSKTEQLYTDGWEAMKYRDYPKAVTHFSRLLEIDPNHKEALVKMAELEYRRTNYKRALELANNVLQMDTYHPSANYFAGLSYEALGDTLNALETLGWAARSINFRTASFYKMAEIYMASQNYKRAKIYANKALDFNRYNLNARYILALIARLEDKKREFDHQIEAILGIDALNHFAKLERAIWDSPENMAEIIDAIENEFPGETVLELALLYQNYGFTQQAVKVLGHSKKSVKNQLWLSYLLRDTDTIRSEVLLQESLANGIDFVFPYRCETLPVLEWANTQAKHWKLQYYLAQNALAVGLQEKGIRYLQSLGDIPDSDIFYRFRAQIADTLPYSNRLDDFKKALTLNAKDWRVWEEHIQLYLENDHYGEAYALAKKAYKKFPENYSLGLSYAKALVNTGKYQEVLKILENIGILPFEHARESREIYERAHMAVALQHYQNGKYAKAQEILKKSKEWPENIGVGKPYDPDEREQDFLLALTLEKLGKSEESQSLLNNVVTYTKNTQQKNTINHLYGLLATKKLGGGGYEALQDHLEATLGENHPKGQLALLLLKNPNPPLQKGLLPKDLWNLAKWSVRQVSQVR